MEDESPKLETDDISLELTKAQTLLKMVLGTAIGFLVQQSFEALFMQRVAVSRLKKAAELAVDIAAEIPKGNK